jgi:ubiquinone/menaquinone biosynthesis C-methylase UbiE
VGVGTGKTRPYYLKTHAVFAIDISARMLERAKGVAAEQSPVIHLAQMEGESLAFRARF